MLFESTGTLAVGTGRDKGTGKVLEYYDAQPRPVHAVTMTTFGTDTPGYWEFSRFTGTQVVWLSG